MAFTLSPSLSKIPSSRYLKYVYIWLGLVAFWSWSYHFSQPGSAATAPNLAAPLQELNVDAPTPAAEEYFTPSSLRGKIAAESNENVPLLGYVAPKDDKEKPTSEEPVGANPPKENDRPTITKPKEEDEKNETPKEHKPPGATRQNETALWTSFFATIKDCEPSFESLNFSSGQPEDIGFEKITADTPRLNSASMSPEDIAASTAAHKKFVKAVPDFTDLISYTPASRGIVTVGGGTFTSILLVSLRLLRRTGSTLPMEVFLPSEADYDTYTCEVVLRSLNAKCVIFPTLPGFEIARYQYKSFAIALASFEHTLFLDSDSFPVVDPNALFDSPPYTSTGLLTWPDYWASTASHLYFEITALTDAAAVPPPMNLRATTESGQLLINRREHAQTLILCLYYNIYGPKKYYRLLSQQASGEGDKDTFLAAATVLGAPFYQVKECVGTLGFAKTESDGGGYWGIGMMQFDPVADWRVEQSAPRTSPQRALQRWRKTDGARPVFVHQNNLKLNPWNLLRGLSQGSNPSDEERGAGETGGRMWGARKGTEERFGFDFEGAVWEEVVRVACDAGYIVQGPKQVGYSGETGDEAEGWKRLSEECDGLRGYFGGKIGGGGGELKS